MDNREKSARVGTYNTGQRQTKQTNTGQRQTKQTNTAQKPKKMSNSKMLDINIGKHTHKNPHNKT